MSAPTHNQPRSDGSEILSTCIVSSAIEHGFCLPHDRCGRPDCKFCEWIKSKIVVSTVDRLTVDTMNMLSITLTLPPATDNLERQMKRLISGFNALRRLAPWVKSIVGGVRCVHVPYRPIDQSWHPHIHVLAEGWPTEAKEIRYRWLMLTGGYAIIKVIDGEEHRRRMAWYVSKSPNEDLNDQPERLAEFIAIRGKFRLKRNFGNLYGNPLYGRKRRSKSRIEEPNLGATEVPAPPLQATAGYLDHHSSKSASAD